MVEHKPLTDQLESSFVFLSHRLKLYGGWNAKEELKQCNVNLRRARFGKSLIQLKDVDNASTC